MRRVVGLALIILLCSVIGWAANPVCVPGTLASYIALGQVGCTVGDKLFFAFSYEAHASGGAREIPPTEITITPAEAPFNAWREFAADWSVESGQTQESVIGYSVFGLRRIGEIAGIGLEGAEFGAGLFGTVSIDEFTNIGDLRVFLLCAEVCRIMESDALDEIGPVRIVEVVDKVKLDARIGPAALSSFTARFSSLACVGPQKSGCGDER